RFSDLRQIAQVVVRAHELLVAPLFVGANQPHDHLAQFGTPSRFDFLRMHFAVSLQEGNRKVQYKLQLFKSYALKSQDNSTLPSRQSALTGRATDAIQIISKH